MKENTNEVVSPELNALDKELLTTLKEEQTEKMKKEFTRLESLKSSKGNAAKIFKLRSEILGSKKCSQEPTAVKDPITGEMEMDPTKIKEIIITFCKNLLTNRSPSLGYESDILIKKQLHEVTMAEIISNDIEDLQLEMFNNSLRELWIKKGDKYKFVAKSGYDFKNALFSLFQQVWRQEKYLRDGKTLK